jgi:hypothetical protein
MSSVAKQELHTLSAPRGPSENTQEEPRNPPLSKEADMRNWFIMIPLVLLSSGCASTQLKYSTVNAVNTLADMQYRQVLSHREQF